VKRIQPKTVPWVSVVLGAVAVSAVGCGAAEDAGGPTPVKPTEPPHTTPTSDTGHKLCKAGESGETKGARDAGSLVTVGTVTRNPRGPDTAATLNNEVVTLTSTSEHTIDLTGWTVEDGEGVSFKFPNGSSICRYVVISIHSGPGADTQQDFFADWGWRWDDSGDTVRLRDSEHLLVAECTYEAAAPALNC